MGDIDTPEHSVTNLRLIAKWLADDGLTDPAAFLVRLASKLPELEQDAERYRWLRDTAIPFQSYKRGDPNWLFGVGELRGPTFDAAIDAARKEKGHG